MIACIEDPDAINNILTAVKNQEALEEKQTVTTGLPNSRAPPTADGFIQDVLIHSPIILQANNGL